MIIVSLNSPKPDIEEYEIAKYILQHTHDVVSKVMGMHFLLYYNRFRDTASLCSLRSTKIVEFFYGASTKLMVFLQFAELHILLIVFNDISSLYFCL